MQSKKEVLLAISIAHARGHAIVCRAELHVHCLLEWNNGADFFLLPFETITVLFQQLKQTELLDFAASLCLS